MSTKKPPTQTFEVKGIEPIPITMNPPRPVDWRKMSQLTTFQLFMGGATDQAAFTRAQELAQTEGDQELLARYCAWFEEQGNWPNETPFGELK